MSWFGKETVEAVGGAVTGTIESINYALSGDLPPDVRVKLEEIKLKMQELDTGLKSKMLEIVAIDAKSNSKFQSWWRPALGWVGVVSLALFFLPQHIMAAYIWTATLLTMTHAEIMAKGFPAYPITSDAILELVFALLGMGIIRQIDKMAGTAK